MMTARARRPRPRPTPEARHQLGEQPRSHLSRHFVAAGAALLPRVVCPHSRRRCSSARSSSSTHSRTPSWRRTCPPTSAPTHLAGEVLGLYYLGLLLPEFRRSPRCRETSWRILRGELARQVRVDGVYFEQATQFHRYTTDFYIHARILGEANGVRVWDDIEETLGRLL